MSSRLLAFVAIGAGVVAVGCGGGSTTKTLVFEEREGPVGFVDSAPDAPKDDPRPAPGDQFTFSEDLADSSGEKVGMMNIACEATAPGKGGGLGQCTGTATVPGGTIALSAGGAVFGKTTTGAVTGGTGSYAGASGSFTDAHDEESGESRITFHLSLPER
jgi:hypothetical protein